MLLPAAAVVIAASLAGADMGTDRMRELATSRYGPAAAERVDAWHVMMSRAGMQSEPDQLEVVNSFFNRVIRFDDDRVVWKQPDYWASPLETLGMAAGDCEDFAIAKYVSLRLLGVPTQRLRLIYVRAEIGGSGSGVSQAHMVLGYYATPDAEPLVLDNLISSIRPGSRRPDLFPVFSFTDDGLWVSGAKASSADPTTRLSRWRDVLERMRKEGFALDSQ